MNIQINRLMLLEEQDQYDSMYFFPKNYGLTDYVKEQHYEKNNDSFSLQIKASEADLGAESFEGVIEVKNNEKVTFFSIDYPLEPESISQEFSIFTLILFAFLGGLILNVMPCVFPILSIKIVDGIDEAIRHINTYGSGHTDCIVTEDDEAKNNFLSCIDSSSVMHNLPTCYADGFEYGLGAEVGISTDKLHARGPVGLEGLTSQKFIVEGSGQLRE